MIALTFDDGPDPTTTPQALDILNKYHVKATFFMLGKNVSAYPEVAKRVRQEGHEIGIHTWNHPVLTKLPLESAQKEIMDTKEVIQKGDWSANEDYSSSLWFELIVPFNMQWIKPLSCGMWIPWIGRVITPKQS